MAGFTLFVIFLLTFVGVIVALGMKSVPQGSEWTVERFGRYTHTLEPGLRFTVPVMDRIGARMNMMETALDLPSQEVITKDNALVRADGVISFQVLDAAKAAYEVSNPHRAVMNLAMTNVRSIIGSIDLDELRSKRDEINQRLLAVMDDAAISWGVKITHAEIKDNTPPDDLVDSITRPMGSH